MVMNVAKLVEHYPDEPPHALDHVDGTEVSIFCDWELRLRRQGMNYTQEAQRWKVLLFSQPTPGERFTRYKDFKTTVLETMDRYDNNIVVNGDVLPILHNAPMFLIVPRLDTVQRPRRSAVHPDWNCELAHLFSCGGRHEAEQDLRYPSHSLLSVG